MGESNCDSGNIIDESKGADLLRPGLSSSEERRPQCAGVYDSCDIAALKINEWVALIS